MKVCFDLDVLLLNRHPDYLMKYHIVLSMKMYNILTYIQLNKGYKKAILANAEAEGISAFTKK